MVTHGGTLHGWLRIVGSGGLLFVAYTLCRVRGFDDDDMCVALQDCTRLHTVYSKPSIQRDDRVWQHFLVEPEVSLDKR